MQKALEENGGDIEAAKQWLREKGLAASAKRDDRDSAQGIVALQIKGNVGAIVKLKCETDFVAASEHFLAESTALVELVIAKGEAAVAERSAQLEDLKILLKEKSNSETSCGSKPLAATCSIPTFTSRADVASTVFLLK